MLRSDNTISPQAATTHLRRRRRGDRGLTTLEWLLIVAAVAGLAALAVVLVQNVVDDTAEQIAGSSARITAAEVAAQQITDDRTGVPDVEAKAKCERLQITYGDAFRSAETTQQAFWGVTNAGDTTTVGPSATSGDHTGKCHIRNAPSP